MLAFAEIAHSIFNKNTFSTMEQYNFISIAKNILYSNKNVDILLQVLLSMPCCVLKACNSAGTTTRSITTLSITTFSIMTLIITMICHYAEWTYAECCILFSTMLSVIVIRVIMLIVVMLSVVAPLGWPLQR
jgi:hypothetical protein